MTAGRKWRWSRIFMYLILAVFVIWTVIPILLVVSNSFKTPIEIKQMPPSLFFEPTLANYERAWGTGDFGRYFINSAIIAGVTTAISVICGAMGGYALVLTKSRWGRAAGNMLLLGKLVPAITILIPFYLILNSLGVFGNWLGPIMAHCSVNLPFVIWLMLGFIKDIPSEIMESAMVDGARRMQIFWKILIPMLTPASLCE